jgi:hypothetical protein
MQRRWRRTCQLAGNAHEEDGKRAAQLLLAMQSTVLPVTDVRFWPAENSRIAFA